MRYVRYAALEPSFLSSSRPPQQDSDARLIKLESLLPIRFHFGCTLLLVSQ